VKQAGDKIFARREGIEKEYWKKIAKKQTRMEANDLQMRGEYFYALRPYQDEGL
jgi:hypothetical protein